MQSAVAGAWAWLQLEASQPWRILERLQQQQQHWRRFGNEKRGVLNAPMTGERQALRDQSSWMGQGGRGERAATRAQAPNALLGPQADGEVGGRQAVKGLHAGTLAVAVYRRLCTLHPPHHAEIIFQEPTPQQQAQAVQEADRSAEEAVRKEGDALYLVGNK